MHQTGITIRDVAKQAGVSVSTVSLVLNGNSDRLSSATRERVLEVVRVLNYRPNAIARSMVKRSTATVGLVITELQNPLFVPVTEGVEEVLRASGYHIVLASANDAESELRAIDTLLAQQVDGFIFMSLSIRYPDDNLLKLKQRGVPFVVINRDLDDNEINRVQLDDCAASQAATSHLLNLGHTRIAIINGPRTVRRSAQERYRGWLEALTTSGITPAPQWLIEGDYTFEGGYKAAQQLVALIKSEAESPTALFISNESMAVGALKAFYEAGVRVPHDLAIVTIGDPPFAAYTIPALTTFALPVYEAGLMAARILVGWLKNGQPARAQKVTLSCSMKVRESCGAYLKSSVASSEQPEYK